MSVALPPPAPVVAAFDMVLIPVPVDTVPRGTKVKDIRFMQVSYAKHQVPAGALTSFDGLGDAVTETELPAKLPLYRENLNLAGVHSNPVMEQIPQGMRAITLRVDATSAVEGWAGSGSIVDVLLVEKDKTSVIAENVKVLSSERSTSPVEGAGSPNVPTTATILVTQEQCLAINTALPLGKISFALRSMRDGDRWRDPSYTPDRLRGGGSANSTGDVRGAIILKGGAKPRYLVLQNNLWIESEVLPEGYRLNAHE